MQAITTSLLPSSGRAHGVEPRHSTSVSHLSQVQTETRTSTDIAFVTAAGDKVTLSADSLAQAAYTSYDAHGRLRGQRLDVQAETLQLTSAQSRSLVVEGELNAEELEDIQQVLDTLGEFASDFFAGELDKPLSQAFDLGEFDTLSSVTATLEYSQNITVSQLTQASVARDDTPHLEANAPALHAPPRALASPQNLLKQILQATDAAPADPTKGTAKAAKFFDRLLEKLAKHPDFDTPKQQLFNQLASQLLRRLPDDGTAGVPEVEQSQQGKGAEGPSTPLA